MGRVSLYLGEVLIVGGRESRVHQSKSWYYLGLFQTFKVELLAKIVSGYKPLTFFKKGSNSDISLVP